MRVTLNDLSRLPVERLRGGCWNGPRKIHSLLSRLHATLRDTADVGVSPASRSPINARSEIIGQSVPVQHVVQMLQRYATTDEPVLITGEIGTGKELAGGSDGSRPGVLR